MHPRWKTVKAMLRQTNKKPPTRKSKSVREVYEELLVRVVNMEANHIVTRLLR